MFQLKSRLAALLVFLVFTIGLAAQTTLPRSTPEAEGVSSAAIAVFLDSVNKSKHEFHSFMFVRHGKVIAEGWWNPYRPNLKHTLYSVSKSFTSTAVGFAVSEKLLTVNDKVVSFFPESLPDSVSEYLAQLTVKDLLTMSVGHQTDPTPSVVNSDSIWVRSFLALPIVKKPGSTFLYNSLATYTLSAIVQKVTGQKVIDYLRPRLFEPLAIEGMDWEVDPKGINTGGWGLRLKTEDLAKMGQLYLQKGKWNGKRLLPQEWVEEATTAKIDQAPTAPQSKKDSSDWMQGYCYQFWRSRHNSFRADGAFGQYILVLPEQDAVIAITSETTDMQDELNLVWKLLLPAMKNGKLPANKNSLGLLQQKLSSLVLPPPEGEGSGGLAAQMVGKRFAMQPNNAGVKNFAFTVNNSRCELTITTDTSSHTIAFANGSWQPGITSRRGPNLLTGAKAHAVGLPAFVTGANYRFTNKNTLELLLRYVESPHTETITCRFEGDNVTVDIRNSIPGNKQVVTLQGTLQN